jgi:ABC-type tungstate transport system substrate-binding protein
LSINLTFIIVMNSFIVTDVTLAVAVVISVSIASIVDEEETAEARAYNSYVRGFLQACF